MSDASVAPGAPLPFSAPSPGRGGGTEGGQGSGGGRQEGDGRYESGGRQESGGRYESDDSSGRGAGGGRRESEGPAGGRRRDEGAAGGRRQDEGAGRGPRTDAPWHVDDRCTNCDVARQLAPGLIGEVAGRSEVLRQPADEAEERRMLAAAFACPTRSVRRPGRGLDAELDPFPLPLDDTVLLCGHNSPHTAGANAYLVRRPGGSWMMVDTPRWSEPLAARYAALGPVTDVLLTHRDHAAHGRRYADRLGARLWIHEGDLEAAPDADRVMRGTGAVRVGDGVLARPLPGHTRGSVLYLVDERYCFSGDSFYWSRTTDDLEIAETVTWHSVEELAASLARTVGLLHFAWLLPGHGDRKHLPAELMALRLGRLADRARTMRQKPIDFTAVRW